MGGSTITNKPKHNKLQVGSGGDTHLINSINSSITPYQPCANQEIPYETPPVYAQSTKKTLQMDSKSPKLQPANRCPGHHHTSCSCCETVDNGATTHAYTKDDTGIDTGMVHFTLPFNNVTATPNGIIVKYPDGNIAQETHSALLKLPFLPAEARLVHLFDTLASGLLLSLRKLFDAGGPTSIIKKVYIFFQGKFFLQGVISASTTFLCKLNKYHNHYQENK